MMEGAGGRGFFDASAYMLFEASGDSEASSLCIDGGAWDLGSVAAAPAEDDAQSCSCGSENEVIHDAGGPDNRVRNYYCGGVDDEDEDEDEDEVAGGGLDEDEDGVVDQCTEEKAIKSNGWEGSNAKAINDREGDRLFWEMCLTS